MRAIWKGVINFATLSVPVKLYSAVKDISVHAHLLHDHDKNRLEQRLVCSTEGSVIERNEVVKGYEIEDDQYVIVEPQELNQFEPQSSREIQVKNFVDASQVDPKYMDRTYYLGPDTDEQIYVNFKEGLKRAKAAGICHWVMRKKSYIGVLEVIDDVLTLTTHRYAREIVPENSFELEKAELSKKEKDIAKNLISEFEKQYQPQDYHDEYQAKLQKLIEEKARGHDVKLPALKKIKQTEDKQLLSALEKSLSSIKKTKTASR